MEIIGNKFTIVDNIVSITLDDDIADNTQYEIRLKNFKSKDGIATLDSATYKVVTNLSPSYCNISDVAVLVDVFKIPESTILYYIREASRYVDYIINTSGSSSPSEVTFPMREFVKTKTMIDCLLKAYVTKAASGGIKGTLGVISFENTEKYASSIDDILDDLWMRLNKWEDALKGYALEGRAAPVVAVKASSPSRVTTFDQIINDISRTTASSI